MVADLAGFVVQRADSERSRQGTSSRTSSRQYKALRGTRMHLIKPSIISTENLRYTIFAHPTSQRCRLTTKLLTKALGQQGEYLEALFPAWASTPPRPGRATVRTPFPAPSPLGEHVMGREVGNKRQRDQASPSNSADGLELDLLAALEASDGDDIGVVQSAPVVKWSCDEAKAGQVHADE